MHPATALEPEHLVIFRSDDAIGQIGYGTDSGLSTPLDTDGIRLPVEVILIPINANFLPAMQMRRQSPRVTISQDNVLAKLLDG